MTESTIRIWGDDLLGISTRALDLCSQFCLSPLRVTIDAQGGECEMTLEFDPGSPPPNLFLRKLEGSISIERVTVGDACTTRL